MDNNIEKALDNFFQRLGHTPGPWMNPQHDYEIMTVPNGQVKIAKLYLINGRVDDPAYANARLIVQSPVMLRTLCRTYLWMLVNVKYRGTLTVDMTLADLRNQISEATSVECQEVQDSFEQYALWIEQEKRTLPPKEDGSLCGKFPRVVREEPADQRDPETKVWSAMQGGTDGG